MLPPRKDRRFRRTLPLQAAAFCEPLEPRKLLSTTVSLEVLRAVGSETNPTTTGRAWMQVTRTGDTSAAMNVYYAVRNSSTAKAGVDYEPLSGWVTLPAGRASINVPIVPIDDAEVEPAEVIVVELRPGKYQADPDRSVARFYIADNDVPSAKPTVGVVVEKAVADEGAPGRKARITFTRTGPTDSPLNVSYALTGTAVNGVDYEALSGIAKIPAGQDRVSIEITAIEDGIIEPAEWGRVSLNAHSKYDIDWNRARVVFYIADSGQSTLPGWWNAQWHYRTALTFNSGSFARTDKPFVADVNFTNAINAAGGSGSLILNSLRVVETDASGSTVIDADVPFQFDPAADFNAASNAVGQLVILATGNTAANTSRHYHVYFDTQGTFNPATVTPRVVTTDNVMDQGQSSVRIATTTATYFYQKENGGFSSILDVDGNDWVSYQPGGGSAGEFRGIPNAVYPGGGFHPGFVNATTTIVSQGPLRTVLRTDAVIDQGSGPKPWSAVWEIYPTYATCTFITVSGNYWFLYEGTPGGSVTANDYIVRSDGTVTTISQSWDEPQGIGSTNGSAWLYFGDAGIDRYLFMAQHANDNTVDSYWLMDGNMTVFGFGRGLDTSAHLTGVQTFTIGIADGGLFAEAAATINSAYRDASVTIGLTQKH